MEIKPYAKPNRKRLEKQLLNTWLWEEHRDKPQWRQVRLGPLPTHELARMYMVTLRFADAVILDRGVVNIVEAKLRPDAGAIGQLLHYKMLFRSTHEFQAYASWPIKMTLLTSFLSLDIVEFASAHDVKYELWSLDPSEREELQRKLQSLSNATK